jgi:hypothetical protein
VIISTIRGGKGYVNELRLSGTKNYVKDPAGPLLQQISQKIRDFFYRFVRGAGRHKKQVPQAGKNRRLESLRHIIGDTLSRHEARGIHS